MTSEKVRLVRSAEDHPDSFEAFVKPEDVAEWTANGWTAEDAPAQADEPQAPHEPAAVAEPDPAQLTKAEIIADLEGMGVDFDPRAPKADLLALRAEARAIRDA